MSRTVVTVWHASLSALAALFYFLFVLPRWWELTGFTSHTLGTVFRILLGVLIGLTALPVAAALKRARKPEYGTPQLALTLLTGSIVAHVVAGTLIAGTAVSEIWLSLDSFGMWLFGIYGAAAAIALLGVGAYYLSLIAEMPPPPPKPIKPKVEKQPRQWPWSRKKGADGSEGDELADDEPADDELADDETVEVQTEAPEFVDAAASTDEADPTATPTDTETTSPELPVNDSADTLRPTGKRQAKSSD